MELDTFLVSKNSQYMVQIHVVNRQEVIGGGTITIPEQELYSTVTTDRVKRQMREQRLNAQAYDPRLNLRDVAVRIKGENWVFEANWGAMFNRCNIGELAVLSLWVFFEGRNNKAKFLFRLDAGYVPRSGRFPSIRELQQRAAAQNRRM